MKKAKTIKKTIKAKAKKVKDKAVFGKVDEPKVEPVIPEEPVEEIKEPEPIEIPVIPIPPPEAPVASKTVYWQNASVVEVLGEKGDFLHCRMSDLTTKHVPRKLFE